MFSTKDVENIGGYYYGKVDDPSCNQFNQDF